MSNLQIVLFLLLLQLTASVEAAYKTPLIEVLKSCSVAKMVEAQRNDIRIQYDNQTNSYNSSYILPKVGLQYTTNEFSTSTSNLLRLRLQGRPFNFSKFNTDKEILKRKKRKDLLAVRENEQKVHIRYLDVIEELSYLEELHYYYKPVSQLLKTKKLEEVLKKISYKQIKKFETSLNGLNRFQQIEDRKRFLSNLLMHCSRYKSISSIKFPSINNKSLIKIASLKRIKDLPLYKRCRTEIEISRLENNKQDYLKNINLNYRASRVIPSDGGGSYNQLSLGVEFNIPWGENKAINPSFTRCHEQLNQELLKRGEERAFLTSASSLYPIWLKQSEKYKKMLKTTRKQTLRGDFSLDKYLRLLESYDQLKQNLSLIRAKSLKYIVTNERTKDV